MTALFGIPVIESRLVPPNRAYLVGGRVLAGDASLFVHRIQMEGIKRAMRADLEAMLDAFAARWGIQR